MGFMLLMFLPLVFGLDPYDFSKSYHCSTCFTNNQDQNYHCCFYFFKCCGEARRGSKSTTPRPHYPAIPTQIVQSNTAPPCAQDCSMGTVNYMRAEQEFEGYVEADTMVKSSAEDEDAFTQHWSTADKLGTTDKQTHLALGANSRPSNLDPRHNDFNKKLFIPPSLASGHEQLFDSQMSRKLGWVTKDLLKFSNGETRK